MSSDGNVWTYLDVATGKVLKQVDLAKMLGKEKVSVVGDAAYQRMFFVDGHSVVLWDMAAAKELCRIPAADGEISTALCCSPGTAVPPWGGIRAGSCTCGGCLPSSSERESRKLESPRDRQKGRKIERSFFVSRS